MNRLRRSRNRQAGEGEAVDLSELRAEEEAEGVERGGCLEEKEAVDCLQEKEAADWLEAKEGEDCSEEREAAGYSEVKEAAGCLERNRPSKEKGESELQRSQVHQRRRKLSYEDADAAGVQLRQPKFVPL